MLVAQRSGRHDRGSEGSLADESSTKSGVQSVERAFELLEIMASSGGSIALGELAARAELPQPTIHRLVRTLLVMGYVRQLENRRYALGPKLIRLGESAAQLIGAWSRPHLTELVERTGESANMAVLDNDMAVYVAQVPSPHAMRMFTEVGRRVHLHCTGVGKALLMQLPNDSVEALLKRAGMPASNENSYTTPDALIRDIELSRSRGYAVDEGEQEIGVRCFAVPVPDAPTLDRDLDLGTGSASHPEVGDQSDAAAEARRPRYRLGSSTKRPRSSRVVAPKLRSSRPLLALSCVVSVSAPPLIE